MFLFNLVWGTDFSWLKSSMIISVDSEKVLPNLRAKYFHSENK